MAQNGVFSASSNLTLTDFFEALKDKILEVTDWTLKSQSLYSISFNVDDDGNYLTLSDDASIVGTTGSNTIHITLYNSRDIGLTNLYSKTYSNNSYTASASTARKLVFTHISTKSGTFFSVDNWNVTVSSISVSTTKVPIFAFNVPIVDLNGNITNAVMYEATYHTPTNNYSAYINSALNYINTTNYLATQRRYIMENSKIVGYIDGSYVTSTVQPFLKYSFGGKSYIAINNSTIAEV